MDLGAGQRDGGAACAVQNQRRLRMNGIGVSVRHRGGGVGDYQSGPVTKIPRGGNIVSKSAERIQRHKWIETDKEYRPTPPYLYSDAEITRILEGAKAYPSWQRFPGPGWRQFQAWTFYCIFGLLTVSGMRIGEVLNLQPGDIDWSQGVLTIRNTKFGKSRLVPLHSSTLKALRTFARHRDRFFAQQQPRVEPSHFFVSSCGTRLFFSHVHKVFMTISCRIGLRAPGARSGPRLHHLRHRFAIETLLRWYRAGEKVERLLPVLSTYLGHAGVTNTYWYLRCTPELMAAASDLLERRWKGVR